MLAQSYLFSFVSGQHVVFEIRNISNFFKGEFTRSFLESSATASRTITFVEFPIGKGIRHPVLTGAADAVVVGPYRGRSAEEVTGKALHDLITRLGVGASVIISPAPEIVDEAPEVVKEDEETTNQDDLKLEPPHHTTDKIAEAIADGEYLNFARSL